MTSLFVGLPALLTSGGLGRFAAYESTQLRRRAVIVRAAGAHALAGLLLTFIAALPHGYLPKSPLQWLALGVVGLVAGALCGVVIGVACTGAPPRQVTEMFSLVKRPGVSFRQLIESEDLGRISAAVRHRASSMFDGLLDPAAPRPERPPADAPGDAVARASIDRDAGDRDAGDRDAGDRDAGDRDAGERAAAPKPAPKLESKIEEDSEAAPGVGERGGGEPKA